jgi:hypothetical protein
VTPLLLLARDPRRGVREVLASGRPRTALILVLIATAIAALNAARIGREVPVEEIMFGERRSAAVDVLLCGLGRDLTAVVLHLFERAWTGILVASALGPVFIWLLGATAIHASAALNGVGRPLGPMFVLHGYATGLMRPVADGIALAAGPRGPGAGIAGLIGGLAVLWLGVIVWQGIRAYYGVSGGKGLTILMVALVLFYLVPLALIFLSVAGIVAAAIVLEFVPTSTGQFGLPGASPADMPAFCR